MQKLRKAIPWYAKFGIKLVRGSLPINYSFFAKLGFFRHGKMDDPKSAVEIFQRHFSDQDLPKRSFVFLEMGPGDSLFSGIIASYKGASASYLVDHGDWVSKDVTKYLGMIEYLFGTDHLKTLNISSIEDVKRVFNIHHLTGGLADLRALPADLVDISFSNAVLEHVYASEMFDTFKELKRISKKDAVSSHYIDFKDHLAYSLNNLRFSEEFWEKPIVKKSGIYTNRLRFSDIVKAMEEAGFHCEICKVEKWPELPVKKQSLDSAFFKYSIEDLLIRDAWVKLT